MSEDRPDSNQRPNDLGLESCDSLFEGLPIGIERIDLEGRILDSNTAHHEMHGYEPGELIGKSIFDLTADKEQAERLRTELARLAAEQPPPAPWVGHDRCQDGSTIDVRVDWQYEHNSNGVLIGFVAAITDITQQVRAERERDEYFRALEENRRHLASLMESAVGFVLYRLETSGNPFAGDVVFVSPSVRDVLGTDTPLDFSTWFASIVPEDIDRILGANRQSSETGAPFDEIMRIFHPKKKEVRWLRAISRPIFDDSGAPRYFNGLILDVTKEERSARERHRFELKLQQRQRLESLGTLAGGIAHDFNNLLVGVLGSSEMALGSLERGSPAKEHIEAAVTAAERAADLTNQLLAYSGRGTFKVERTDLNALLQEMTSILSTVVSKKAELLLDLAEELRPVQADVSQIRQVVMNLITNASDALGDDAGTIRVTTSAVEGPQDEAPVANLMPGPYVRLEIADTGCGMTEATAEQLYDPFFTTKALGRGLGLAAVRGIVHGHLGAIHVDTAVGSGTTFSILLPAVEPAIDLPLEQVATRSPAEREQRRILIIDDEDLVRSVAQRILQNKGHEVFVAGDGIEGIELFKAHANTIDTVLLDMNMPRLSGEETFELLRGVSPDIRVVFSTGYHEQEMSEFLARHDNVDFIQKPYRAAGLLAKVCDG